MNYLARCARLGRKQLRVAARIVGVIVVLELAALAGWWSITQSRLGRLELLSRRAILTVEVLDESGETPIGEPITIDKKAILTLPDGEYRLRVSSEGLLGQTYRATVNRGETIAVNLSLDEGRLLGGDRNPTDWNGDLPREDSLPFADETIAVELVPGKADIVEYTGQAVTRRDGVTGKAIWNAVSPNWLHDREHDPGKWLERIGRGQTVVSLVQPVVDLDGDGTRDVVLVGSGTLEWIALSGKDGSKLWNRRTERPGASGVARQPRVTFGPELLGQTWIDDVDGDGTPELVATVVIYESLGEILKRTGSDDWHQHPAHSQRTVQAISGRTGRTVWTFPVDPTFTQSRAKCWDKPATLVRGRQSSALAILDGSRWIRIQPHNGLALGDAIDLGFEPVRPLQYGDIDGDGEPEILALGPGSTVAQQSLTAVSSTTGKAVWTVPVLAALPARHERRTVEWPWVIDLEGDGRTEVVVPDCGPLSPAGGYLGFRTIDGVSGKTRWVRPMRPENKADDGLNHVVQAPDLDGDGVGDLIANSKFDGRDAPAWNRGSDTSEPARVYTDAISGRDGRLLWSWHTDLFRGRVSHIGRPHWWGMGPDGRPLLAVAIGRRANSDAYQPAAVHVLEASTGRERHRVVAMSRIGTGDLDGDGLMDLWGEADDQLRAFRGELPEAWRTAQHFGPASSEDIAAGWDGRRPAVDFDGDGTGDVLATGLTWSDDSRAVGFSRSRTAIARSGRDGRLLWKTILDPPRFPFDRDDARSYGLTACPLPTGDFDGDGMPDVIARRHHGERVPATLAIQALSGRNGRRLWSAGPLPPLPFESSGDSTVTWFRSVSIGPNGAPDVLVRHLCPDNKATITPKLPLFTTIPAHDRLARISGRSGRVLWDVAVDEQLSTPGFRNQAAIPPTIADMDGDGAMDAVFQIERKADSGSSEFDLKVISLRDGATRWSKAVDFDHFVPGPFTIEIGEAPPGQPAIIYVKEAPRIRGGNSMAFSALDGRDGSVRWTWSSTGTEGGRDFNGYCRAINLDGKGKDSLCMTYYCDFPHQCGVVILNSQGRERARCTIPESPVRTSNYLPISFPFDLDGDGRDELLVQDEKRLSAWGRDMKAWWSIPSKSWPIQFFPPASSDQPGALFIDPITTIDGVTGKVRWTEKSPPWGDKRVLAPGDPKRTPRLLSGRSGPVVCREALPVTTDGDYAMPAGVLVPSGLVIDDPRWRRELPWVEPMRRFLTFEYLFAAIALALVNIFVPLGILRLAARRRAWRVRTLMVLPVVVAIPLWTFQTIERELPAQIGAVTLSPKVAYMGGTLAGTPLVVFVGFTALYLVQRRWTSLAGLACLTSVAAAIIGVAWLRVDSRAMPAIEHYGRAGWPSCFMLGAYTAGALNLIGLILTRSYRFFTAGYRRSPEA